jgi:hypothetical protein
VLVTVDRAGLVRLGAAQHDAVRIAVDHAQEQIGVGLRAGPPRAVAAHVGHRARDREVLALGPLDERHQAPVVLRAARAIARVRHHRERVDGVEPRRAQRAAARAPRQQPLPPDARNEVVAAAPEDVRHVHRLADKAGLYRHPRVGLERRRVGLGDAAGRRCRDRVVDRVLEQLPAVEDAEVASADLVEIPFGGLERHAAEYTRGGRPHELYRQFDRRRARSTWFRAL